MTDQSELPRLTPSGIGNAVKSGLQLRDIRIQVTGELPLENRTWKEATRPLSSLQSTIGMEFERHVYDTFRPLVDKEVSDWHEIGDEQNRDQYRELIRTVESQPATHEPTLLTQAPLSGTIGLFSVGGDADMVLLCPTDDGVDIGVYDIKSSWEEKPHQQIQTATYTHLFNQLFADSDLDFTLHAGVIYRDTPLPEASPDIESLPTFTRETREGDVKRMLGEHGPFVEALTSPLDELPVPSGKTSPYAEVHTVTAIEQDELALLEITPSERTALRTHGLTTLADIAQLYEPIGDDGKPYKFDELPVTTARAETVAALEESSNLATDPPVLAQRAQSLLGKLDPENTHAHDKPWTPWIHGAGSVQLPEDDPAPQLRSKLDITQNSLIRVYLNVQYDHVRDCLACVSGRVDCGLYDKTPLTFSTVDSSISRDSDTWKKTETRLLEEATSKLYSAIEQMAELTNQGSRAPVHMYVYTEAERDALHEATVRHSDAGEIDALRCLIEKRDGIDQQMMSVVEPELTQRMAVKPRDTSVAEMTTHLYPSGDDRAKMEPDDWMADINGTKFNLRDAFYQRCFDSSVPIRQGSPRVLSAASDNRGDADDYYAAVPRSGAQIPIEYLWAAEDVGVLDESWTDQGRQQSIIERYMWADTTTQTDRLTSTAFAELSKRFAHSLNHIERALQYKTLDIDKRPVEIESLRQTNFSDVTLADACREYLDLEYEQTRADATESYRKSLKTRILDGDSVPIRLTDVSSNGYSFTANGELLYDEFDFENPSQIAGASAASESDRCVMTGIQSAGSTYTSDATPNQLAISPRVSISAIDPRAGTIEIQGFRSSSDYDYEYSVPGPGWTTDKTGTGQYVGAGTEYILDADPSSRTSEKAIPVLDNIDGNTVYEDIIEAKTTGSIPSESQVSSDRLGEYVEWIDETLEFALTDEQTSFVCSDERYSLLQGPPGTGKTSGAMTHALLARAFAHSRRDEQHTGMVTGLSNKSVDELLDSVASMLSTIRADREDTVLDNTRLLRLVYEKPDDGHDAVEYIDYYDEDDMAFVRDLLLPGQRQQHLGSVGDDQPPEHALVFATPGRLQSLAGKLVENTGVEEAYKSGYKLFDVLAVDEASMMPIHQLFMSSAFLDQTAQLLVAGDHRQLSPVQKYDWTDEQRQTVSKHLPHLSVLDYFRYLRGDAVSRVPDESQRSPNVTIPITRLDQTFRCNEVVTDFLRQSMYRKDDIDYKSQITETIPAVNTDTDGIEEILSPDKPMTVVIHDDRQSRQVNRPEANIVNKCISGIPESEDIGIVTPHNAQKGLLDVVCDRGLVDTVERFQGDEKSVMFLSTTVSDPLQLEDEEEFILSPKRLNVALSRMEHKLVVLAPRSVFELVPSDTDTYQKARIWKELFAQATAQPASWSGSVGQLVGSSVVPGAQTALDVYHVE